MDPLEMRFYWIRFERDESMLPPFALMKEISRPRGVAQMPRSRQMSRIDDAFASLLGIERRPGRPGGDRGKRRGLQSAGARDSCHLWFPRP
jgi:hypothetical protein